MADPAPIPVAAPPTKPTGTPVAPYRPIIRGSHTTDQKRLILVQGPAGEGKCLGRGTPVLLYDGSTLPVERICRGDSLMGPSGHRTVLATNTGNGLLYRITPVKGDSWICNEHHILTLVRSSDGFVSDIGLQEYLSWAKSKKADYKLLRSGADFGFSVEAIGEGEFFGFTLDGDGRFLLGDFTVTHNSWFACSWPNPFVILFDPGSATHDRLNVPYAAVSGWAEVERYWLRALEQRRISELVQSIEDEAGNHPYADYKVETLVLDSLTFLVDDNLLELGGGGAKDVGQQGWDTYYSRVLRFLNAARRCARPEPRNPNAETYHLVATVHENVATTGEHGEYQEVKNAIQGKMNGRIAAFFDGHYLTERVVKGDIIEYFIRTKPSRRQIAGRGKEVITVTRDCKGDTIIGSDKMPTRLPNNYEAFARAWGWIK